MLPIINTSLFCSKEISAWGLIQALSEKDAAAFTDSVKRKGFNTLLVSIISDDTRFAGDPPTAVQQAIEPEAIALAVFGGIAGLATLLIAALMIGRFCELNPARPTFCGHWEQIAR